MVSPLWRVPTVTVRVARTDGGNMPSKGVKVRVNRYCHFCQRMDDRVYKFPGDRHWYCSKECHDNAKTEAERKGRFDDSW